MKLRRAGAGRDGSEATALLAALSIGCIALSALCSFASAQDSCQQSNRIVFHSEGTLAINGILNIASRDTCSGILTASSTEWLLASGLEDAAAAIWTVSRLNQLNYLPQQSIGLTIFDGCEEVEEMRKSYVESLVLENCVKPNVTTLGTFASNDVRKSIEALAIGVNRTFVTTGPVQTTDAVVVMLAQLLQVMSINTVHRVIAESSAVLAQFGRKMADDGICVYDQVTIDDRHAVNNEILNPPEGTESDVVSSGAPVIVVIAEPRRLLTHFENLSTQMAAMTNITWILATPDGVLDIKTDALPSRTITLSAVIPRKEDLIGFLSNPEIKKDPLNHRQPTKSPLFLTTSAAILDIVAPFKELNEKCNNSIGNCEHAVSFLENVGTEKGNFNIKANNTLTQNDIVRIYKVLNLPADQETPLFNVQLKGKSDDIALFEMYDAETFATEPKLLIFKERRRRRRSIVRVGIEDIEKRGSATSTQAPATSSTEKTTSETIIPRSEKHPCHEALGNMSSSCGICLNFVKYLSRVAQEKQEGGEGVEEVELGVGWRFEAWVTINASVAAMGSLCVVAIFMFVVARICMGDVLEGSPALSFFLLIAMLLTYLATLPFSFQSQGNTGDWTLSAIICDLRVVGPPLTFSILFSIMLSRSFMLAASDQDGGFMSHVNGYLQAVIIFFVSAVEFAIAGEYVLFNSFLLAETPDVSCQSMHHSNKFMFLLVYDAFILLLLVAVMPFMMRSKRNYREGAFFTVSIMMIFVLWCVWIPLYYIFPDYKDAAILLGLTGTPTAIILCIFIPRTYLMTTAIVRDRIVNTLPPLVHSEHQFRSTQALYDTLNLSGKIGAPNPNFYSINPIDSGPGTPQIRPGQYYSTDGLKPNTPKKSSGRNNENARGETPENAYQAFDSPIRSPSRVTRF